MATNVPTVRQVAWISLIPQLILMGIIIYIYDLQEFDDPFLFGALTYLILSFGLRNLVARDHINEMKHVKKQQFESAVPRK